jgi:DNA-binding response OmpR family regulator
MNNSKILVVDDEKDLREALHTALKSAGFNVVVAENGKDGLEVAEQYSPDLILLDIDMPVMNGHQMLAQVRRASWGKKIPVLLLTNADDMTNISKGIELNSNDYIIKSQTSLQEIVTVVKQHLVGYHD